ncbi:c-type cytochrome [Ideonella sp. DXS29W]|uniref:C-type cytochrome n=1 Tax=Ideonella lacteola TaxID=2984193 RepID=A0ABU9BKQ3_9BURK
MSDAQRHAEEHVHDGPHEGPIKTPKQLVWAVVASFVVPIVVIIMLTQFVATGEKPAAGTSALDAEAVARRIHPVSSVEVKDVNDTATLKTGEQVFQAQCSACHNTGAAGAPKFGDEAAWAPRIKNGFEALLNSALKGKGNMGPQGGGDFSDLEIARAVVYMANKGGAKFDEPKAPAAAASAAQ